MLGFSYVKLLAFWSDQTKKTTTFQIMRPQSLKIWKVSRLWGSKTAWPHTIQIHFLVIFCQIMRLLPDYEAIGPHNLAFWKFTQVIHANYFIFWRSSLYSFRKKILSAPWWPPQRSSPIHVSKPPIEKFIAPVSLNGQDENIPFRIFCLVFN
jgi:hypothetical protein